MNKLVTLEQYSIILPGDNRCLFEPLNFSVNKGECVALTGPSGAGKSLTAFSLLGFEPDGVQSVGKFFWNESEIVKPDRHKLAGTSIGLIMQDPVASLNPVLTIGDQLIETVCYLQKCSRFSADDIVLGLIREVQLDNIPNILDRYPHQLSGGQCQRVMIALSLVGNPELLIADEPTTSLDVTVQRAIMSTLYKIRKQRGMALLLISHDSLLVEGAADKVIPIQDNLRTPLQKHHETFQSSNPKGKENSNPVLEVRNLHVSLSGNKVLRGVDFSVAPGELKMLVGESGCGKTTFAKTIAGLNNIDNGSVRIGGKQIGSDNNQSGKLSQIIFQHPVNSLNPRQTVNSVIAEALKHFNQDSTSDLVVGLLRKVGLDSDVLDLLPYNLSGGECQRVAICRALVAQPKLLIADEPTSSLDPEQTSRILFLLSKLCKTTGLAVVVIAHNIVEVAPYADSISVMRNGKIVEEFAYANSPEHHYSIELLDSASDPAGLNL